MRDTPNASPAAMCKGKHAYASWADAQSVVKRSRRARDSKGVDRRAITVYRCPLCHSYHIGGLE
jgi:hypothetical protein